jgi:hypothetical protein
VGHGACIHDPQKKKPKGKKEELRVDKSIVVNSIEFIALRH